MNTRITKPKNLQRKRPAGEHSRPRLSCSTPRRTHSRLFQRGRWKQHARRVRSTTYSFFATFNSRCKSRSCFGSTRRANPSSNRALGGLRKRNHIPDARCAAQNRNQPVEAERDAAVRRRAIIEMPPACNQTAPSPCPAGSAALPRTPFFARRAGEYGSSRPQFHAVHHNVVMLAPDFLRDRS